MSGEFRLLRIDSDFRVTEIATNNREPLDWAWVGKNRDLVELYNKLLGGGWDKHANRTPTEITVRRIEN